MLEVVGALTELDSGGEVIGLPFGGVCMAVAVEAAAAACAGVAVAECDTHASSPSSPSTIRASPEGCSLGAGGGAGLERGNEEDDGDGQAAAAAASPPGCGKDGGELPASTASLAGYGWPSNDARPVARERPGVRGGGAATPSRAAR